MTDPQQDLLTDIEGPQVIYSTFWQRFGAIFIDGLVLSPIVVLDYFNKWTWKSLPLLIATTLIGLAYRPFMESKYYATLGKMAMNLTIINTSFEKPGLRNIVLRDIFDIIARIAVGTTSIITFLSLEFQDISSAVGYTTLSNSLTGATYISWAVFMLTIVDTIFLLADRNRRALHDRIGQTLVIQKR